MVAQHSSPPPREHMKRTTPGNVHIWRLFAPKTVCVGIPGKWVLQPLFLSPFRQSCDCNVTRPENTDDHRRQCCVWEEQSSCEPNGQVPGNRQLHTLKRRKGKLRVCLHLSTFIMYCLISVSVDFRLVYLFGAHPFPPCVCVCVRPFHEAPFIFASRPWCSLSSVLGLYRCYCCELSAVFTIRSLDHVLVEQGAFAHYHISHHASVFLTVYFLFAKKNRLRKWSVSAGDLSVPRVSIVGGASLQTPQWEQVEAVANHLSSMCISVWGTAKLYYI